MTATDHIHPQSSILSKYPVATGAAIGIGTLVPHAFLGAEASLAFAALVIALIAGVYLGFAVMNGSEGNQMVEFGVATAFAVAGLLGFLLWPILLPVVYFAHAAWDFAHHNRARLSLVTIRQWYVPFCIVIDVIIGAGLIVVWYAKDIL